MNAAKPHKETPQDDHRDIGMCMYQKDQQEDIWCIGKVIPLSPNHPMTMHLRVEKVPRGRRPCPSPLTLRWPVRNGEILTHGQSRKEGGWDGEC